MRQPCHAPSCRHGLALIEVIVGGVMLAIGLAAVITVSTRALAQQSDGERRLTAAWLADELLNMVVVEGPDLYPKIHDTFGNFEAPFADYEYEVVIKELGPRQPFRVTAFVRWPVMNGKREISVETFIALRLGETEELREPMEAVDREGRYFDEES